MATKACVTKEAKGLSFFERYLTAWVALCIAAGIGLGKLAPGAALATVVGVLIEVPVMLVLVRICPRTTGWFRHDPAAV